MTHSHLRCFATPVTVLATLAALGLCTLAGCSKPTPYRSGENYVTVGKDPRRDTDRARRENEKARRLIEKGKWDEAEATLKHALEADVTFGPAHNNLGSVYFHRSHLYLAAWEFQYAIKLMPKQAEPLNNLAMVMEAAGKLDEAITYYDKAVESDPNNVELIANSARARVRRGDRDSRLRALLEAVVLRDTRAAWVTWAREQIALVGSGSATRRSEMAP